MSRPKSAQEVGIMVGYPHPKDQLVTLANWQDPPFTSQVNVDNPDWSPDGRWIAFASDRANPGRRNQYGKYDNYYYNLTTGVTAQVTQGVRDVRFPAWASSQDATTLIFVK